MVTPNEGFTAIAAGGYHNLALKPDSSIVAWGRNAEGQCNVPWPNTGFTDIAAGAYHNLGLKTDGSIASWGYELCYSYLSPCVIQPLSTGFVGVGTGYAHSLALAADTDGDIRPDGLDNCPDIANPGQENDDDDTFGDHCDPCPDDPINDLDGDGLCGSADNCPRVANPGQEDTNTDGIGDACAYSIRSWGAQVVGVPLHRGFAAVSCGHYHNLGLRTDGSAAAWGRNNSSLCYVPPLNTRIAAVAAAWYYNFVLTVDGTVVVWGLKQYRNRSRAGGEKRGAGAAMEVGGDRFAKEIEHRAPLLGTGGDGGPDPLT
ncbi:MAG TPA: thrombospondin type 3 repeat-containing protein, partial [Phycisphaerae bacterium]|nr:thrombospondin type 3 repeat-containing protein [Phycisphaerae bacterium]